MAELDRAGNNVQAGGYPILKELPHPAARRVILPLRSTSKRHYRGFWRRGLRCYQRWTPGRRTRLDDLPPTDPRLLRLSVCQLCAELGPPPPDP